MPTTAKVVCDSISESGQRITTLVLEYPRIIHSEFMTHRMFSRNASSSRAIPVEKQIERVEEDGFIPSYIGKNQKGMQANEELDYDTKELVITEWNISKRNAIDSAKWLIKKGVHKQLANRLLEPFSHIQVVVTATEWDNFFLQRLDKNAQPEIQELAKVMKEAMDNSTPKLLKADEWHLPFVDDVEWNKVSEPKSGTGTIIWEPKSVDILRKVSVARCARVSYGLNERGWGDIEKDLALYDMLLTNNHWSPFEHQATPMNYSTQDSFYEGVVLPNLLKTTTADVKNSKWENGITHKDRVGNMWSGNFKGWVQNRQLIQQSNG